MTRRVVGMAALLVTALVLQTTVLPVLLRPGYLPDLVTVLAVLTALERGARAGLWVAGAGGLVSDLLATAVPLGGGIAVAAILVIAVGLLRPYLGDRSDLVGVLLAGLAAGVAFLLSATLRALLATDVVLTASLLVAGVAATTALGAVMAVPLLQLLRRVIPEPSTSGVGAVA